METELGIRESADQLPGIDLGDGNIKTSRGTIRTPKRALHKAVDNVEPKIVKHQESVDNYKDMIDVVIHSDFGDITYKCISVLEVNSYLVLEMLQNNFAPKAYSEAPDLRLPISWNSKNGNYVFTGCKWTQASTGHIFVILMEVD